MTRIPGATRPQRGRDAAASMNDSLERRRSDAKFEKILRLENETKDSNFDAVAGRLYFLDTTGGTIFVNLPSAKLRIGAKVVFKDITTGGGIVQLVPQGDELIDGTATKNLSGTRFHTTIISDGEDWWVIEA